MVAFAGNLLIRVNDAIEDPRGSSLSSSTMAVQAVLVLLLCLLKKNQAFLPIPLYRSSSALHSKIDYNNPVVAEEFAAVQPLPYDEVEAELRQEGIPVSAALNEMDVKLMLVELRLRKNGKLKSESEQQTKKPTKFSNKLEEALWTKPAFKEFYNKLKEKDDHNAVNVVNEYLINPAQAQQRYGSDYRGLLRRTKAALNAVTSPTVQFSGFPANMGEIACRQTLEAVGSVTELVCEADDTFPILKGSVTFETVEDAKKAIDMYHGMDMGMGQAIEMVSV